MRADPSAALVAAIYEAAWPVRHYCRPAQLKQRDQALERLGLAVREAFNASASSDFERLLYAICDALAESPDLRFAVRR